MCVIPSHRLESQTERKCVEHQNVSPPLILDMDTEAVTRKVTSKWAEYRVLPGSGQWRGVIMLKRTGKATTQVDAWWDHTSKLRGHGSSGYRGSTDSWPLPRVRSARHSVASSSQVDMTITTLKQTSLVTTWGPTNVEHLCILCGGNSPDSLPSPRSY